MLQTQDGLLFGLGFNFYRNVQTQPGGGKIAHPNKIVMPRRLRTFPTFAETKNVKQRLEIPGLHRKLRCFFSRDTTGQATMMMHVIQERNSDSMTKGPAGNSCRHSRRSDVAARWGRKPGEAVVPILDRTGLVAIDAARVDVDDIRPDPLRNFGLKFEFDDGTLHDIFAGRIQNDELVGMQGQPNTKPFH